MLGCRQERLRSQPDIESEAFRLSVFPGGAIEFPFFRVKAAPASGKEAVMDYAARFEAAACGDETDFVLTVKANVRITSYNVCYTKLLRIPI